MKMNQGLRTALPEGAQKLDQGTVLPEGAQKLAQGEVRRGGRNPGKRSLRETSPGGAMRTDPCFRRTEVEGSPVSNG